MVNGNNRAAGQLFNFNLMASNYGYNHVTNNNMTNKDNNNINNKDNNNLYDNNNNNVNSNTIVHNSSSLFYPKLEKSHINNFMKT